MDKSWMHETDRTRTRYSEGVKQFINMARGDADRVGRIKCPCHKCTNRYYHHINAVETHLIVNRFDLNYTEWIFHGEEDLFFKHVQAEHNDDNSQAEDIDDVGEMLDDIYKGTFPDSNIGESPTSPGPSNNDYKARPFDQLWEDAQPMSRYMYAKKSVHFSGRSMLIKKNAQNVILQDGMRTTVKRLFMSKDIAKDMRWHKDKRLEDGDYLRHLADSIVWKEFDKKHAWFAADPRNVRLGLASDGFNPFGNMSTSYSMWPVVLMPYNLPPWRCMKDPYMILSLLIPRRKAPGNKIDVYLRLLVDDLKEL
ncbi:hypothetical protein SO802_030968 [Lithocarpus litseifolius]|uniref:Transposase-associated domain-containing protein n=1 Tax=Lithocarpus litseifolius TaxID=425828 RepID=A0AAW2BLI6_9ROSI